jgi:shikimate kinase/3-dehydroquinate synthase
VAPLVVLTGFMGSGKSSVGARVAARLGLPFVDLDEEFVRAAGISIEEFFAVHGETAFRERELTLLAEAVAGHKAESGSVIALGGGALTDPRAKALVRGRGGVVFLDIDAPEAWARVRGTGRPLARDRESFDGLLERRRKTYEEVADWVFPVGGRDLEAVAADVCDAVQAGGPAWQRSWGRRLAGTERESLVVGGEGALTSMQMYAARVREKGGRFFIVTDRNVMRRWGDRVSVALGGVGSEAVRIMEPGETSKSVDSLARCWDWLAERGARRDDVVVALGGGVVGDLAGFAAATYRRGVTLWQIPTSLLAQVDSSIGGKNAVDLSAGKNLVGTFYQPDLVVIDPETLTTLPGPEFTGGLGEVVKHALLRSADGLAGLETAVPAILGRQPPVMSGLVKGDVSYKASIVARDEHDRGERAVLNLGHTTAHALEVVLGYGVIHHGQAVALGLLASLAVSELVLGLDPEVRRRTTMLLGHLGLRTSIRLPSVDLLLAAARHDKKVRSDTSGFVGLRALGVPVPGVDVSPEVLVKGWEVIGE